MVDYTNAGFIVPIIKEDIKGYASVNSIFYPEEDGIDFTGGYFVYLLHPLKGSTQFTLTPENSYTGWAKEGGAYWLTPDLIKEITDAIEANKQNQKVQQ